MIMPSNANTSEHGVYIRLEGYSLTLVNAKDGQNLISHFFNLDNEFEALMS
jgi:hypothetical protein